MYLNLNVIIYTYIYIYIHICIFNYMYIYMHIYIYKETERILVSASVCDVFQKKDHTREAEHTCVCTQVYR